MKNFLSVDDVKDVEKLLKKALKLKKKPFEDSALGKNKTIGVETGRRKTSFGNV